MSKKSVAFLMAMVLAPAGAWAAEPTDPMAAAIFAGGDLTFNGFNTVTGGPVVVNGNVIHHDGALHLPSIYAGGTFTKSGAAFEDTQGNVVFGGSISEIGGPAFVIGGNVDTGGSVSFGLTHTQVQGHVTAAGSVNQPFALSTINGDVNAGTDANLVGTVTGSVTYGGTFTGSSNIGGVIVHGAALPPTPYVPLTLPAGRNLTAGTSDIVLANSESPTIAPGNYGTLSFAFGNTVTLTAGHYVFAGITSGFSLNQMNFDTSLGAIDLYVTGDYDFNVQQLLNGVALGTLPEAAQAPDIFVEVGDSFIADSSFYGNVFAPDGDITLNQFLHGHAWAGGNVTVNWGGVAAPEPGTLALLAGAGAALMLRRRRRMRGA